MTENIPETSALLLSVIILHGLGKILITRKAMGVLPVLIQGFHHTDLRVLSISLEQSMPGSSEITPWKGSSEERCFLYLNKAQTQPVNSKVSS